MSGKRDEEEEEALGVSSGILRMPLLVVVMIYVCCETISEK
jgi:hypothetical protein